MLAIVYVILMILTFWILYKSIGKPTIEHFYDQFFPQPNTPIALKHKIEELKELQQTLEETGKVIDVTKRLNEVKKEIKKRQKELDRINKKRVK